jgi:hypothetical protein
MIAEHQSGSEKETVSFLLQFRDNLIDEANDLIRKKQQISETLREKMKSLVSFS